MGDSGLHAHRGAAIVIDVFPAWSTLPCEAGQGRVPDRLDRLTGKIEATRGR
jgi:hypothetical protein